MFNSREKLLRKALALYAGDHVLSGVLREGEKFLSPDVVESTVLTMLFFVPSMNTANASVTSESMFQWQLTYAEAMTATVRASGGTFDNFVGDDGSAWWNAKEHPNHADRAVECGLNLLDAISRVNGQSASFPETRLRIGVHTGRVNLGNYGSSNWLRYCPMGDAVNTAARLSRAAPYSGSPLIVSGDTFDLLDGKRNLVDLGDLVKAMPVRMRAYGIASGPGPAI